MQILRFHSYISKLICPYCFVKNTFILYLYSKNYPFSGFNNFPIDFMNYIIFKMRKLIKKFIFIFIIIFGSNALCSDNCSQCNSNQCTKCAPNFIILNNSCQAYSCTVQHCSVCQVKNLSSCLSCEQGYNLIQNYCNQSISVNVVIIVVMTFVTMILISIALVYLIYYLEKKQNNTNNSLQRSEQKKNQGIILDLEYNLGKTQCTICLTNETDLILTCGHYFHLKCFSDWIMKGKFCPICKSEDLNEIKLVLCMKCKNKCITGTKNDLKKLEGSRISYKCICNERPIVDSNMILLY